MLHPPNVERMLGRRSLTSRYPRTSTFACMHAKSLQSCLTLCESMNSSPPGSSIHRILQARILEWVTTERNLNQNPVESQSPTFLTSEAGFMEDIFPIDGVGEWFWEDSSTLYVPCTLLLFLLHQLHIRSLGIGSGGQGPLLENIQSEIPSKEARSREREEMERKFRYEGDHWLECKEARISETRGQAQSLGTFPMSKTITAVAFIKKNCTYRFQWAESSKGSLNLDITSHQVRPFSIKKDGCTLPRVNSNVSQNISKVKEEFPCLCL